MKLSPQREQQANEDMARLLIFLWPREWLQDERGVGRCILATRVIIIGLAAVFLASVALTICQMAA